MGLIKGAFLLLVLSACHSTTNKYEEVKYEVDNLHQKPKKFAQYPGGANGIKEHILLNLKYPKKAYEKGLEGRVVINYIVNSKGDIENIKVVTSIHNLLDQEAIRVIKIMERWKPGYLNGRPISIEYSQPFVFQKQ